MKKLFTPGSSWPRSEPAVSAASLPDIKRYLEMRRM